LADSLVITPSGTKEYKYKYLSITNDYFCQVKNVIDYYYKYEGFDEVYSAFSKMGTDYTEKEFARMGLYKYEGTI
jgi:hypothetical protein